MGCFVACTTTSPTVIKDPIDTGEQKVCTSGPCAAVVTDARLVDCESDSGTMTSLTAAVDANGTILVEHYAVKTGCCPTFTASATYDQSTAMIDVDYAFVDDFCDCICALDVSYAVSGVPAGDWTLTTSNAQTTITIE